jgi:hypothetical protein
MTEINFRRTIGTAAVAIGFVVMASAAAQAFTFNDQADGASSNSAIKFDDPADRAKSRMTGERDDKPAIRNGNSTLQFGARESFDQRNNSDRYFNPNNLMGR